MWNLILVTTLLVNVMHRVTSDQEGCGKTWFSRSEDVVASPKVHRYRSHNNMSCTYFINAGPNKTIYMEFRDFELDDDCSHDWLMITCKETNDENIVFRRRHCGILMFLPDTWLQFSSCPVVELRYYSDSPGKNYGFSIWYKIVDNADGILGCGQTSFSRPEDVITSPKLRHSSSHIGCTYFINAGPHKAINMEFLDFDLDKNCSHDWLMITCSETNYENLEFRRRHCGIYLPDTWLQFISCPVVELRYHSDSPGMNDGFSILYTVVDIADVISDLPCGETMFISSFGVIELPKQNQNDFSRVNCTYTISTNNTSTISLSFGKSPLEPEDMLYSFAHCNREYIMIGCVSDGETELNPNTSIKYCLRSDSHINPQPNHNAFSNCRMVKIFVRSSRYIHRSAYDFSFAVHSSDADCGNSSFLGQTGTILSPGFPLSYPHHLDCVYTIDVDRTKTTSFDFLQFNLEGTSKYPKTDVCIHDWLKVSCLSDESLENKYCGKITTPITLKYSNCDSLTLNFFTDSSVSRDGFQLRYTIATTENGTSSETDGGCGNRSFSGASGFITSPRFPLSYPNNIECVYSIDVDKRKRVLLHFLTFSLEGTPHATFLDQCIYDWILISCISDGEETHPHNTRRRKYCGERTSSLVLSYSNCDSLTLSFVTDSSHTSGGFQLKYTVENGSAETFEFGTNGIIASPWYPFPFPNYISGQYSYGIDVGRKSSILLRFIYFEMEMPDSEGHCRDWLRIICNEPTTGNPNNGKKYCGIIRWTSSLLFVDCSSLEIEFFANKPSDSTGFMIEYTATDYSNSTNDNSELDCGTTLFTNTYGVISLPRNTRDYLSTVNCTYTVSANHLSNIWLDIHITQEFLQLLESFQDCDRESLTIGCVSEEDMEEPYNTTVVLCRYGRSMSDISENRLIFSDCRKLQVSIRSTNYDNPETFLIPFHTVGPSDSSVNTQTSVSGQRGHAVGISLVVIVVVTGAICLGAFLLFRRHLKKKRPQLLMQESAEETHPLELEDDIDTTKPGHRKEDRDTSKYVPLRSMSISDHDTSPPGNNFKQIHSEIQPGF